MSDAHKETLQRVAEEQFEQLAFMFPVSAEELPDGPPNFAAHAKVGFSGPSAGRVLLAAEGQILPPLAANMLGLDEGEPSEAEQTDALKELLNVICGNLLPEIAGAEAVFDVQAPEVLDGPAEFEAACGRADAVVADVNLDSGRARLVLLADAR